jgi:uncharacterized protein
MPATSHPASLRLTEVKLPLDHSEDDLIQAVVKRLGISRSELLSHCVFRRGYDARKKSAIHFIYTLDVVTADNAAVLARTQRDKSLAAHVGITPDTQYQFTAQAPVDFAQNGRRPVVVGTGPCGLFAALTLAQMGFRPLVLERGKASGAKASCNPRAMCSLARAERARSATASSGAR